MTLKMMVLDGLCAIFGILTYGMLVFTMGSRSIQTLALPIVGLSAVGIAYSLEPRIRSDSRRSSSLLIAIAIVVLFQASVFAWMILSRPASFRLGTAARLAADYEYTVRDSERLMELAFLYQKQGKSLDAEQFYGRAIQLAPSNLAARYELARLYETMSHFGLASREYEAILQVSELPDVHLAYASLLVRIGDSRLAIRHLESAQLLYAKDNPLRQTVARTLALLRHP